jgi:hypothetical protein
MKHHKGGFSVDYPRYRAISAYYSPYDVMVLHPFCYMYFCGFQSFGVLGTIFDTVGTNMMAI